jgi:hypothetical protein
MRALSPLSTACPATLRLTGARSRRNQSGFEKRSRMVTVYPLDMNEGIETVLSGDGS